MIKIDLQEISTLKENKVYRINDVFAGIGIRSERDRKSILTEPQYNNTILFNYLQNKQKERDILTMQKIIDRHIDLHNYPTPEENELVIHLRLGDVLDHESHVKGWYELYKDLNKKINFKIFSKISIVTALHFGSFDDRPEGPAFMFSKKAQENSFKFFRYVESKINKAGHSVNLISSNNIDKDFCYMAKSQWFVKSKRGFSHLISKLLPDSAKCFDLDNQKWI